MTRIKCKGDIITLNQFIQHLSFKYKIYDNCELMGMLKEFLNMFEENVIFPLKTESKGYAKDKFGFRIFGWQELDVQQLLSMTGGPRHAQSLQIPIHEEPRMFRTETSEYFANSFTPRCDSETYCKALNVTYLVDDRMLEEFKNGMLIPTSEVEIKNIADKKVKDCSIIELLYAINKKLEGKEKC